MIQFIGLSFTHGPERAWAVATVVDRKARVLWSCSAPVGGVTSGEGGAATEVRPGEWVRAGSLALRDAFFRVPARIRRVWGFSLAGPHGWVALDPSLEPLTPLRLTPTPREDLIGWLARNPRERPHIYSVLTPKDYFRYAVSGALATDVTQADRFGLLEPGETRWSTAGMEEAGLATAWFPPVFDSPAATGRISEEGIQKTGLPGGLWVVAGAETAVGPLVSAGDMRSGILLASSPDPRTLELRCVAAGIEEGAPPEGFETLRAPFAGHRVLRRVVSLSAEREAAIREARGATGEALRQLRAARVPGLRPPERVVLDYRPPAAPPWAEGFWEEEGAERSPFAGAEDPGIAFLAGLAQGAYRTFEDLYRRLREARQEMVLEQKEEE